MSYSSKKVKMECQEKSSKEDSNTSNDSTSRGERKQKKKVGRKISSVMKKFVIASMFIKITSVHAGQEAPAEHEPRFNPFTGSGKRLDGKPLNYHPPPSSGSKDKRPGVANGGGGQSSTGSSSQGTTRQTQGKLVFGANVNRTKDPQKEAAKEPKQEQPPKKEEPKFQPFTGKMYSLKG